MNSFLDDRFDPTLLSRIEDANHKILEQANPLVACQNCPITESMGSDALMAVNDKNKIAELKAMGVDGIITDYPNLFN